MCNPDISTSQLAGSAVASATPRPKTGAMGAGQGLLQNKPAKKPGAGVVDAKGERLFDIRGGYGANRGALDFFTPLVGDKRTSIQNFMTGDDLKTFKAWDTKFKQYMTGLNVANTTETSLRMAEADPFKMPDDVLKIVKSAQQAAAAENSAFQERTTSRGTQPTRQAMGSGSTGAGTAW